MLASRTWGVKGPSLLFIHGFLGCKEDWSELIAQLSTYCICHAIDLPGHGESPFHSPIIELVIESIQKLSPIPRTVIGYSLGGRIALKIKEKMPRLFDRQCIFSSHLGLDHPQEKKQRLEQDQKWIQLLHKTAFPKFVDKWYEQEIFHSLRNHPGLLESVKQRRKAQNPAYLALILEEWSLAKMEKIEIPSNTFFFYGTEDLKYAALYSTIASLYPVIPIPDAGHMIHLENPKMCADQLKILLNLC